jgi:hypothetical protein
MFLATIRSVRPTYDHHLVGPTYLMVNFYFLFKKKCIEDGHVTCLGGNGLMLDFCSYCLFDLYYNYLYL